MMVVLLKFNANSPAMHGFILYAQLISTPFIVRVLVANKYDQGSAIKVLATLYGIWNLDFFCTIYPDMCLKITTLQVLALDYTIAFYPLLLILFTSAAFKLHAQGYRVVILMWYPFHKCLSTFKMEWTEKTSIIDVFATFLLLSYGRTMSVSFNLLIYTNAVNPTGTFMDRYLYYDATYEFFGKEHLPFGVLALLVFVCFNILPFLLLLFYPMRWFQRCLNRFKLSCIAL